MCLYYIKANKSFPIERISENHTNFNTSLHCKRLTATKLNLQKQHLKYTKVDLLCGPIFSFNSVVVLLLFLRACGSEYFPRPNIKSPKNKI